MATGDSPKIRLLHAALTDQIIGGFYRTHRELGSGFVESVYCRGLAIELTELGLKIEREVMISVYYHGARVGSFRADLVVESKVVVEIKAGRGIDPVSESQLINYLKATELEVGLLLNFGVRATFRRFVFTRDRKGGIGLPASDDRESAADS